MKSGKPRTDGMTLAQRVYSWLRYEIARPASVNEIAEEFNLPGGSRGPVRGTLRQLLAKGSVRRLGGSCHARWEATTTRPTDLRGLTPGSRQVLAQIAEQRRQGPEPKRQTYRNGLSLHEVWRLPTQRRDDGHQTAVDG